MDRERKPEVVRWGALWRSKNRLDGKQSHILYENCIPVLFKTRRESRAWIEENYGYIRDRKDLQQEPHGWKMPTAVRLSIWRA